MYFNIYYLFDPKKTSVKQAMIKTIFQREKERETTEAQQSEFIFSRSHS